MTKVCLICAAPTNYAHFGIDSCRACAEFYKRTITTNKNYACRQGSRKCKINKNERFICRRCRFDKCRDLGMSLDDPRKRKRIEESERIRKESITSCPPSDPHSPQSESILDRIATVHTTHMAQRKAAELAIRSTSLRQHVRVPHKSEDIVLCSWTFLMDCLRTYVADCFNFAGECFPECGDLSMDDKQIMLRSCAVRVYLLEALWQTAKAFPPGDGPPQQCMITLTTCLDRENIKFLIQDSNPIIRHSDIVRSMTYYMDRIEKILWPLLEKTEFTDTEHHALFGLVVWQIDPSHQIPEHFVEMSEKIRKEIFGDLRRYYREELQLKDYSVRMGNLMTLEHTIQEANSLMEEEIQTYNLLDMLRADVTFLQWVLRIFI